MGIYFRGYILQKPCRRPAQRADRDYAHRSGHCHDHRHEPCSGDYISHDISHCEQLARQSAGSLIRPCQPRSAAARAAVWRHDRHRPDGERAEVAVPPPWAAIQTRFALRSRYETGCHPSHVATRRRPEKPARPGTACPPSSLTECRYLPPSLATSLRAILLLSLRPVLRCQRECVDFGPWYVSSREIDGHQIERISYSLI